LDEGAAVDTLGQKGVVTATAQPEVIDRRAPTPRKRNLVIELEISTRGAASAIRCDEATLAVITLHHPASDRTWNVPRIGRARGSDATHARLVSLTEELLATLSDQ
jgi:hypothetical protein